MIDKESGILVAMRSKKQTPLGYLMELLDVRLADLGEYLYVAQTSISKWKTGARALKPESQHFAGIVEYFVLLSRDAERGERLTRLLSDLYPDSKLETPEDMAACLRIFLDSKLLPSAALAFSLGERGKLYAAEFSVYSGEDGFENAKKQMLSTLLSLPQIPALAAIDNGFRLTDALSALVREGARVRLLYQGPTPAVFGAETAAVFSNRNVEARFMPEGSVAGRPDAAWIAGSDLYLESHGHSPRARYTALYSDEATLTMRRAAFDRLWEEADMPFMTLTPDNIKLDTLEKRVANTVKERFDLRLTMLPYLTMSRALLMEVLESNAVSGRGRLRVLGYYDAYAGERIRIFVPAASLRAAGAKLPELSLLTGTPFRITEAQARRHLLDTAALLRAGERIEVLPLQGKEAEAVGGTGVFVKRNAFAGFLGYGSDTLRITESPKMVEGCMRALDSLSDLLTRQMRERPYVAGLLEEAALR